jgi:uncharacterized membrane protein
MTTPRKGRPRPQRTAYQLIAGTIIAAFIYSIVLWAVIIPSWIAGGSWKIVASMAFILWVFLFIGFTFRHLVVYSRAARKDS